MLVLSRQRDETIMIGDDIEVTVVDIRGDKVRLGTNAPRNVSVHRKEVYDAIRRENRAAAKANPEDSGKIIPEPEQKDQVDLDALVAQFDAWKAKGEDVNASEMPTIFFVAVKLAEAYVIHHKKMKA